MSLENNNINIIQTSGYSPSFAWQVGVNTPIFSAQNLQFRATVRPLNGNEDFSRIPSPEILYEETGIVVNDNSHLGTWTFPLDVNAQISGGPYRDYQVVIEAHDTNGNTSAGNIVNTSDENGWVAFNQGYDIIAISNPRQTGIELSNNLPTQYSLMTGNTGNLLNTGFTQHINNGYLTLNYMGAHGEINIRYLSGNFNSNLVGGYIYAWTGQFPKYDTLLGLNGYNAVSKTQFNFDPQLGYVYSPTAAIAFRGANNLYISLSFYDNIDKIAIDNGIDISTGLYLSDNAICYNDIAAGSLSLGSITMYAMQYTGTKPGTGVLGTGVTILSEKHLNGNTTLLYISTPLDITRYGNYTGANTINGGGYGGNAILLNNSNIKMNDGIQIYTVNPSSFAANSSNYYDTYALITGLGLADGSTDPLALIVLNDVGTYASQGFSIISPNVLSGNFQYVPNGNYTLFYQGSSGISNGVEVSFT